MLTVIAPMLIFALVGAVTPGPVNIIATSSAANFGFARTLPHVSGASLGYTLVVFLAGTGLNEILLTFPGLSQLLRYAGAGFLLYMAFRIAAAQGELVATVASRAKPPSIWEGALVQILNPKAWLVAMSGVALFVTAREPLGLYLSAFCVVSFLMCALGVGTWAAAGHVIRRQLTSPRNQAIFNTVMSLLLGGTIISLFVH